MNEWTDQVAIVTGAAGDIGAAICTHLSELGARVSGADREVASGSALAGVDVTDSPSIERWLDDVESRLGPPTIAVLCAGISRAGRLVDTSNKDWDDVIGVNLTGAFFTARAVIRRMLARGSGGRIVLIGSWAAHAPHPHIGAYSTSKAGLRALGQTLALDHAADGILVNEVAPGIVNAGLSRALFQQDPRLSGERSPAFPLRGSSTPATWHGTSPSSPRHAIPTRRARSSCPTVHCRWRRR